MGKWAGTILATAVWASIGCGQTSDRARDDVGGAGGTAEAGGHAGNSGRSGGGGGSVGGGGAAGVGGAFAGSIAGFDGGRGGTSGAGGAPCTPVAHARPTPGTLSRSFSDIAAGLAGVYLIDSVFGESTDCSAMCSVGNSLGGSAFAYRYVAVQASVGSDRFDITGCENPQACADPKALHFALGSVDMAVSDQILSAQRTKVQNPQGQECAGATVNTWLVETSPTRIRIDVQSVNVSFAATYDPAVGLYSCDGGDVESTALGQACNDLDVIDGTKVD